MLKKKYLEKKRGIGEIAPLSKSITPWCIE